MRINDHLELAVASVRHLKEYVTANGPDDLHPIIEVWRGEDPIAVLTLRDIQRNEILHHAHMSVLGFDADALAITFEGYQGVGSAFRNPNINPLTGKRWDFDEMQDVAINHDGIAKGWVAENLTTTIVNRAGDLAACHQAYGYREGRLVWGRAQSMTTLDEGWEGGGVIPRAMVKMMEAPSGSVLFPFEQHPVTRDERDVMVAQTMKSDSCAVALYARKSDTERLDLIKQHGEMIIKE